MEDVFAIWRELDAVATKIVAMESEDYCDGNISWCIGKEWGDTRVRNLQKIVKSITNGEILEIGFAAGHSSAMFLQWNDTIKVTAVDLETHKYVQPCYEHLEKRFPGRLDLFAMNSVFLPKILSLFPEKRFDLIYIDGGKDSGMLISDLMNAFFLASENAWIVMDDYIDSFDWGRRVIKWWNYMVERRFIDQNEEMTGADIGQAVGRVRNQGFK